MITATGAHAESIHLLCTGTTSEDGKQHNNSIYSINVDVGEMTVNAETTERILAAPDEISGWINRPERRLLVVVNRVTGQLTIKDGWIGSNNRVLRVVEFVGLCKAAQKRLF